MEFSGSAQRSYRILRAPALTNPAWVEVGRVLTDANGKGSFEDQDEALGFPAFYQVVGD